MTLDPSVSPMMLQWQQCKQTAPEALLLFRLGDFYEAFYDDAVTIAKELDLTLTKRQEIPMAGVPAHTSDLYIDRLVAKGYRVAVAEQMENPRAVKGIVKREVVRVVTPGTLIQSSLLSDKTPNFLACIIQTGSIYGLSALELTTADFTTAEFTTFDALLDALYTLRPKELLISDKWETKHASHLAQLRLDWAVLVVSKPDRYFDAYSAASVLRSHFKVHSLDGFGLKQATASIQTAGALLYYVQEELRLCINHVTSLSQDLSAPCMHIDRATQKHLELVEPLHAGAEAHTLLHLIDRTLTPMGGRLMRQWLTRPLMDLEQISQRQEAIAEWIRCPEIAQDLKAPLSQIYDLPRLIMRLQMGSATPKDLCALKHSLLALRVMPQLMAPLSSASLQQIRAEIYDLSSLSSLLERALVDTPPVRLGEGELFRSGFDERLDKLRQIEQDSHGWIARYQAQLREETQIKTLKVGYTKAFGYYIEISRGQSERAPASLQRRQTLVNAERFTTEILKEFEFNVLHAQEQIHTIEVELFEMLRQKLLYQKEELLLISQSVARCDCLLSLAALAQERGYIRPELNAGSEISIQGGRHPVIEAALSTDTYIPNDLFLDDAKQRLYLITGPNMAGKSTFLRQAALLVILAQLGSFVPAQHARIGLVDRIFSRIGASDDLARGQSTFMVEMSETANILRHATSRSLVILDEIGRGTSTYDGIAIAWAVAEYLLTTPGRQAKTLFATHYWELTALEHKIPGAMNYNVAVHEGQEGIIFLRKIVKGGTDKSYGIHVARLAGLPHTVLARATELLTSLEQGQSAPSAPPPPTQTSLHPLVHALEKLDPNQMTPLQALQTLLEWKTHGF